MKRASGVKRKVVLLEGASLAEATGEPAAKRPQQHAPAPGAAARTADVWEEVSDDGDSLVGASERFEATLEMFECQERSKGEYRPSYGVKYNYGTKYLANERNQFSADAIEAAERGGFCLPSPTRMDEWEHCEFDRMLSGLEESHKRRNDPTVVPSTVALPADRSLNAASLAQERGAADAAACAITPHHAFIFGGRAWDGASDAARTNGLRSACLYMPATQCWRRVRVEPTPPGMRYGATLTSHASPPGAAATCYLFGGTRGGWLLDDIWRFTFDEAELGQLVGPTHPQPAPSATPTTTRGREVRCVARQVAALPLAGGSGATPAGRAFHTACLSRWCGQGRGREGASAVSAANTAAARFLWIFGGVVERGGAACNGLLCLDTQEGGWRQPTVVGTLPSPRAAHSAALSTDGDVMYIYGGVEQLPLELTGGGEATGVLGGKLADVYQIDLRSLVATEIVTSSVGMAPLHRCHHTAHIHGRTMHVVGGDITTPGTQATTTRALELVRLDLDTVEWTTCAPTAKVPFLSRHAATVLRGQAGDDRPCIYAFGGNGLGAQAARIPLTLSLRDMCGIFILKHRIPYASAVRKAEAGERVSTGAGVPVPQEGGPGGIPQEATSPVTPTAPPRKKPSVRKRRSQAG